MALSGFFNWLRGNHKTGVLPDSLWQETIDGLPFLDRLTLNEKSRLRELTEAFLSEKKFTPAGGIELTDAMCVSIAVQGCLLILNIGLQNYRDWVGIIVYPNEFIIPRSVEDEFGVVHEYDDVASGEAWEGGPLLISWHDVQMAGNGYNVVIHEFAHKLDMLGGEANGIPPLPADIPHKEWKDILLAAFEHFSTRVDEAEQRGDELYEKTSLDPYATENPGEFFAVMSEAFFETPDILHEEYPEFYELLRRFYRQDPQPKTT